jgi:hypothetical protein
MEQIIALLLEGAPFPFSLVESPAVLSDNVLDGGGSNSTSRSSRERNKVKPGAKQGQAGSFRSRLDLEVEFAHQAAAFRRRAE